MAERASGAPRSPTTSTAAGANWDGRKLKREQHSDVLFTDLDMTEARNAGSVFNRRTCRRARFNASAHEDAAFLNCTFIGCNLFDVRFPRCKLVGSLFDGVRLREADLTRARCKGSVLRSCDRSGASLDGADLTNADLHGSELSALDPREVTLTGAIIDIKQTVAIAQALGLDVRAR